MDFRFPTVAAQQNAKAVAYLTKSLTDRKAGETVLEQLQSEFELGNAVESFPDWHPILTLPPRERREHVFSLSQISTYKGLDHTVEFVRGFITCPYSKEAADQLVGAVDAVDGLRAKRIEQPLYADNAHPVVVVADNVQLEGDGTIRSRDALAWFVQQSAKEAERADVGETWWNIRSLLLGSPHGSRSSLFVNQHTGVHMRKILEAMNESGMFGPIKESSLDMLSKKTRDAISQTLIRTALKKWNGADDSFDFELRGETCRATIRDTWNDGHELSIRVAINDYDLMVQGFYYKEGDRVTHVDPKGKRALAEKFV